MVECLVEELAAVGLSLNVSKTKILTIENLNGPMFLDIGDYIIKFYMGGKIKKYLGKKLFGDLRKRALVGLQHRSQIVWMRFEEHRDTLLNRHVCLRPRLKLFDSVISPTILFSLLTCPLASNQLQKLEAVGNRMLRSIVGWAPLADNVWHALMQKMHRKLENAQPVFNVRPWTAGLLVGRLRFAAKIASVMYSWASITRERHPCQRWKMDYCVAPVSELVAHAATRWDDLFFFPPGPFYSNSIFLRKQLSTHHGFKPNKSQACTPMADPF